MLFLLIEGAVGPTGSTSKLSRRGGRGGGGVPLIRTLRLVSLARRPGVAAAVKLFILCTDQSV
jgi:hypothetical protein